MAQRRTFVLGLREGMEQEYIRRHREIWPEMLAMLREAGIRNYSIWLFEGKVFGYYESGDLAATDAKKAVSPVQARWSGYMADILYPIQREGETVPPPACVFLME